MSEEKKTKAKKLTMHEAFVKAQSEMKNPKMSGSNPHFNSKFSSLDDVLDACKAILNENGFAVTQPPVFREDGVACETVLLHESGESLDLGCFGIPVAEKNPQKYVAALTYCRRASLTSALGLVGDEDDDGNQAATTPTKKPPHERFKDKVNALAEKLGDEKTGVILLTHAETEDLDKIKDVEVMKNIVADLEANVKKEEK